MGGKGCQGVAGGGRGEGEYCDADAMRNSCQGGVADYAAIEREDVADDYSCQGGVADYAAREGRCCR